VTRRALASAFVFLAATLAFSELSAASANASKNRCVRQVQPSWGEVCEDGYQVLLQNVCDEPIRVHWCIRQNDGDLHCGVHPHVAPGRYSNAHACDADRPAEVQYEACSAGERCRVDPRRRR